jgi:hypothetical protein
VRAVHRRARGILPVILVSALALPLLLAGCSSQQTTKIACGRMTIAVEAIGKDLTAAEQTITTDKAKGQKDFKALSTKFTASESQISNSVVKPKADKVESTLRAFVAAINTQVSTPTDAHSKAVGTLSTKLQTDLKDLGTVCPG